MKSIYKPIGLIYRGFNFSEYTEPLKLGFEEVAIGTTTTKTMVAFNKAINKGYEMIVRGSLRETREQLKKKIDEEFALGIIHH